jgi:capsular polysaccharide biosynthesis protein
MQPPRNLKELNPEFQFFALPPVLAYWHWIAEILPMLLRLKEIVPEIITVVNNNQPKYVFELLNQIGTKYILTGDDWVKVPQLWLVDKPVFGFYHPTEVDLVRKLVEDLLPHPSREPGPKHKVYISRMGGSRAMNNERQLESWLESNGYFIFRDREIGVFANQVNLFGNADTIIGSTGSGLANAILMPENSRMVELFSSSLDVPEVITLCASINVRHSRIEVKETEDYPFGDGEQIIGQLQLEV